MKKLWFTLILLACSLLLAWLIGEGTLTLYNYFKHPSLSRADLTAMRENKLQEIFGKPEIRPDAKRTFENTITIHPFFGYVKNSNVNNFGFRTKYDIAISDSGYCLANDRKDDVIVVGIFGGSFAEGVGFYGEYLENKLTTLFPNRVPVVINFGLGGHALPQSAFIFIYFKELFDVIVFIDGLNEVWNAVENNKANCPPEYAKAYHFQYKLSLNELSSKSFILTSQIIDMKRNMARVSKISMLPVMRRFLLVHYVWLVLTKHWDYQIAAKSLEIKNSYIQGNKFFDVPDEFILDHAVRQWQNYHQLVHETSSSRGILDIHFLQPNPFVKESKPLCDEEIDKIHQPWNNNIRDAVVGGYPKLRIALSNLKKIGLISEDLSYIYKNTKESLWVDGCHTNRIGYEMVLDKIFEIIAKNKSSLAQSSK